MPPVNQGRWAGHSTPLTPAWKRDIILAFVYLTLISCDFTGHNVRKDVPRHLKKNETFSSLKTTCHKSQNEGTEKGKMAQWKSISTYGNHLKNLLPKQKGWHGIQTVQHHVGLQACYCKQIRTCTPPKASLQDRSIQGHQTLLQTARPISWRTCEDWRTTFLSQTERLRLWHTVNSVRRKGSTRPAFPQVIFNGLQSKTPPSQVSVLGGWPRAEAQTW